MHLPCLSSLNALRWFSRVQVAGPSSLIIEGNSRISDYLPMTLGTFAWIFIYAFGRLIDELLDTWSACGNDWSSIYEKESDDEAPVSLITLK